MLATLLPSFSLYASSAKNTVIAGKGGTITINHSALNNAQHVFLSPGGAIQTAQYSFDSTILDVIKQQQWYFAAAGKAGLLIMKQQDNTIEVINTITTHGNATQLAVKGHNLFVATDLGIDIIAITKPASARMRGHFNTAAPVIDISLYGNHLALLLANNDIQVINIQHATRPQQIAYFNNPDKTHALTLGEEQLFLAQGAHGITGYQIMDNSLIQISHYRTTGYAQDIALKDDILYIAEQGNGLTLADVSLPGLIHWLGSHQQLGDLLQVSVDHGQALVLNDKNKLLLIDTRRPNEPTVINSYSLEAAPHQIRLRANHAIIANDDLTLLDFSSTPPQYSNESLDFGQGVNYGGERRVFIRGNLAYVADWFSGIHIYDISVATQPQLISSFHTQGSPKGIVVRGNYAYVADDDHGLQIINIKNPASPFLVSQLQTPGLAYIPIIEKNRLYLASHRGGFQIIDIKKPNNPVLLGSYDTPGKAWSIRVIKNIAYVADDESGLLIFNVKDPENIYQIGQFNPGGAAEDVIIDGNHAYVTFFDNGVFILDISNPEKPVRLSHIMTAGNARGIAKKNSMLYIADWLAGIQVVDISTPRKPLTIDRYDTEGAAWGIAIHKEHALVMDWWGGLTVLNIHKPEDIHEPQALSFAGRYHHRGNIADIYIKNNIAYTATGHAGLQAFDVRNPLNPTWFTGVDLTGASTDIAASEALLYVAHDSNKMTSIDISDPYTLSKHERHTFKQPFSKIEVYKETLITLEIGGELRVHSKGKKGYIKNKTLSSSALDMQRVASEIWFIDNDGLHYADMNNPLDMIKKTISGTHHTQTMKINDSFIVIVNDKNQIHIGARNNKLFFISATIDTYNAIHDIQLIGHTLHVLSDNRYIDTYDLSDIRHPILTAHYQTSSSSRTMVAHNEALYLTGGKSILALQTLPKAQYSINGDRLKITIPALMPEGDYTLNISKQNGNRITLENIISVKMPKLGKPSFSHDDFKKALQKIRDENPTP